MQTIWKYPLPLSDMTVLKMPKGAVVLTIDVQHKQPMLWALVDPETTEVTGRRFYVRGTGHLMGKAEGCAHIGTFQLDGGSFVGHVFADHVPEAP